MKVRVLSKDMSNCDLNMDGIEEKQIYNVYGIYFFNQNLHFLFKREDYGFTPALVPAKNFEIVDSRLFSDWVMTKEGNDFSIICREWVEFPQHLNFFGCPWEFEDDFEILLKLDSFHYWVDKIDKEFGI